MIEQINTLFDTRFYASTDKLNKRTGLPYFPSTTMILNMLPESPSLRKWRFQFRNEDECIAYVANRAKIGTFVHDKVDRSIRELKSIPQSELLDEIQFNFKDNADVRKVWDSLVGWNNFLLAEEPEILSSEQVFIADDYAGTADQVLKLKSDNYKRIWLNDLKTSKSANEHHKIQVTAYMKALNLDMASVLVLGNDTKTKFTLTKVQIGNHDKYMKMFNWAKEGYYMDNPNPHPRYVEPLESFKTDRKYVKLIK